MRNVFFLLGFCFVSQLYSQCPPLNPVITPAGPVKLCPNGNVVLRASTNLSSFNVRWNRNGIPIAGAVNVSYIAREAGTYTVEVWNPATVCTPEVSAGVEVSFNPPPAADAGPDVTICRGVGTPLGGSGGVFYNWSPRTGLSSNTVASPTANPINTTTYVVTVTDANNCTATDAVTVTVLPLPQVNAGRNLEICAGRAAFLNGSGAVGYSWEPNTGLSANTVANPVANPSQTTTYTLTGTGSNGCTQTATVTVTVRPLPPVSAGTNKSICPGGSAVLNGSGASTYVWEPTIFVQQPTAANPTVVPTQTTTFTVTGTDALGCVATATATVTVNEPAVANAGDDIAICFGVGDRLQGSGGVLYQWSPAVGLSDPTIATPFANPTSNTLYTLVVTDANGCRASDVVRVTVNTVPANAGVDVSICTGQTTPLQASGGVSYLWNPASLVTNSTSANTVANPPTTTIYTVIVTGANGCTASDEVVVTVHDLPYADAGADVNICAGSATRLTATGGRTYSWLPTTNLLNPNSPNPTASPTQTTIYTVIVTDANGCSATDEVQVVVREKPRVAASQSQRICFGEQIPLRATGGIFYRWSPAAGLTDVTQQEPVARPLVTTRYVVTVTAASGCSDTASVLVTVLTRPMANAGVDVESCRGQGVLLTATGGTLYNWAPTTGLSATNLPNPQADPQQTTTYTVTVTSAEGCTASDMITVTVLDVEDKPEITLAGPSIVCEGGSIAMFTRTRPGYTYRWFKDGMSINNGVNASYTAVEPGEYAVAINFRKCTVKSDPVLITFAPLPAAAIDTRKPIICQGDATQLEASGGITYAWSNVASLSDAAISNPIARPLRSTTFVVTVTDQNGCTSTASQFIQVNAVPAFRIEPVGEIRRCVGSEVTLKAIGLRPGADAVWLYEGQPLNTQNINQITVAEQGEYALQVRVDGCEPVRSQVARVIFVDPPNASADAEENLVCPNTPFGIYASGGVIYSWQPQTLLLNPNAAQTEAVITQTTTFTVIVADEANCTNTATVTVAVKDTPEIIVSPNQNACLGVPVQLFASGGDSYTWFPSTSLDDPFISNPVARPTETTRYTVVAVDDETGCTIRKFVTVSVDDLRIGVSADTTLFAGNSVQLFAQANQRAVTFQWFPAFGLDNPTVANPVATPINTTTYTVVIDNGICQLRDSVVITVRRPQAPDFVNTLKGDGSETANDLETDLNNNLFLAGTFQKNLTIKTITLEGNNPNTVDGFLAKQTASGSTVWAVKFGGPLNDECLGVKPAPNGLSVGVVGYFEGTARVGSTTLVSRGQADGFVARVNAESGEVLWVRQIGGALHDRATAVEVDNTGAVYVTGFFRGVASIAEATLTAVGEEDIFLAKYSSNGNLLWIRQAGGLGSDVPRDIALDRNDDLFVTGSYEGNCRFGTERVTSAGGEDIFLVKYTATGQTQWVQSAGGPSTDRGNAITITPNGDCIVVGQCRSTVEFGNQRLTGAGGDDGFVAKYLAPGNLAWVGLAGGTGSDRAFGVDLDPQGNLFVTGQFSGNAEFGGTVVSSRGETDFFVSRLNQNGEAIWTQTGGGANADRATALTCDNTGNVYIAGDFFGTMLFNDTQLTASNSQDIFLIKLKCEACDPTSLQVANVPLVTKPALMAYPNPAQESVTISNFETQGGTLWLINQQGQSVLETPINPQQLTLTLNVADLPRGVYMLRYVSPIGQSSAFKLVLR